MSKKRFSKSQVFFLNPRTCGIHKSGGTRYKVDEHGARSAQVDNELLEQVEAFVGGKNPPGMATIPIAKGAPSLLVPRYFDRRWDKPFEDLKALKKFDDITIGELIDQGVLAVRGGHGSPGNDQRVGDVPYVKVSDIRNLRINVNPTNMVPLKLAKKFWRSENSGLKAWDVVTPNRASSNIGEFAVILPGEERVLLTKEMFVFRVIAGKQEGWDAFYLLWSLCLKAVRMQWQRVTLMQTNREDVGDRYREIRLPRPKSKTWAYNASLAFRNHFETLATSMTTFQQAIHTDGYSYIASVLPDTAPKNAGGQNDDETKTEA